MIKQTVSYGVWILNRHDDNKIEVLKNGQVCEKASPAYREIAAEIGFEIDPEWRTSQLGRNVFKAVENAANSSCSSTTASTPVEEKKTSATEQEPAPKKTISEDKNTQPIQEVSQNETISVFDVILQSKGENALQVVKAVKEQLGIGLGEAKDLVDAAPSTIAKGIDRGTAEKLKLELESVGAEVKIDKSVNIEDLENTEIYALCVNNHKEALEWLCTKCCKSRTYYEMNFKKLLQYSEDINRLINNLEKLGWSDSGFVTNHNALQVLANTIYTTKPDKISAFKILIEKKLLPYLTYNIDLDDMYETFRRYSKDYTSESKDYGKVLYHLCWNEIYKNNPKAAYILYGLYDTSLYDLHIRNYHPLLFKGPSESSSEQVYSAIRTFLADFMMRFAQKDSEIYLFGEKEVKYKVNSYYEHWCEYGKLSRQKEELEQKYKELENIHQKLKDKYSTLEQKYSDLRDREEKAHEKYRELKESTSSSSSSSSSSSRSSSSSSDSVRVKVKFNTDNRLFNMIQGTTRTVTISETEYKSLVKGSMKARVAWVHGKFGVASAITVSDVAIICLD